MPSITFINDSELDNKMTLEMMSLAESSDKTLSVKDLSIFKQVIGNLFKTINDELPVPKSSMYILMPAAVNCLNCSIILSKSSIMARSVNSI